MPATIPASANLRKYRRVRKTGATRSWYRRCHLAIPGAPLGFWNPGPASATLTVGSEPAGAEIYVDGQLLSSTPATFEVTAGNHQLVLKLAGYQAWTRNIHVLSASAVHFQPALEKK
ncbi:MAG TPA: PEGA domain-containing protein [Candidatus Acidoferrum sp.]|nr:PEGA domain-containing protein [Candidatus Acidoferrum sp.]